MSPQPSTEQLSERDEPAVGKRVGGAGAVADGLRTAVLVGTAAGCDPDQLPGLSARFMIGSGDATLRALRPLTSGGPRFYGRHPSRR
jgi:hypothetical protein